MPEISRSVLQILSREFNYKGLTLLLGSRHVGKTHLLKSIQNSYFKKDIQTVYFDLENPQTSLIFNKNKLNNGNLFNKESDVIFLDEISFLNTPWELIESIYRKNKAVKIYASSSSYVKLMEQKDAFLIGKKRIFHILPCNFTEMSQIWTIEPFFFYLKYGGLPALSNCQNEKEVLQTLADIHQSYVLNDVKSLIKKDNIGAFNHLVFLLAERQGRILSVSRLANEIGLSPKTTGFYLKILINTGFILPINSFSRQRGNELIKSYKYYLSDLGIRNMIVKDFRDVRSRNDGLFLYESFVFLEIQKTLDPVSAIHFWHTKDGKSLNFVYIHHRIPYPIHIQTNIKPGEIPPGLRSFLNRYPETKQAFILNLDHEEILSLNHTMIMYQPINKIGDFNKWLV